MKLSKRGRYDTLQNEIRRRGNPWDRLIYFGIVGIFFVWIFDATFGDHVYLRSEGIVLRDRAVLATQFTAQVDSLNVIEGSEVKKGQLMAQLRSQEVEATLARLSSDIANAMARISQLRVRQRVIDASRASAAQSHQAADLNRIQTNQLANARLVSNRRVAEVMDAAFRTGQTLVQMDAEAAGIQQDMPLLEQTISEATRTRDLLSRSYNEGRIYAPTDGIVGALQARNGAVARIGEPLMEVYTGDPFVLAYVPEGAIYSTSVGDSVTLKLGLKRYRGRISRMFPVSSQLPKEFQDNVRQPPRAQVIHITFEPGQQPPTLFAKPRISGTSWVPGVVWRMLGQTA